MLQLVAALLRSLSTISGDPALGPKGAAVRAVLDLAALAVERGEEGAAKLRELTEDIMVMVADGREPSAEEWNLLRSRSDVAHQLIQGWRE